MYRADPLPLPAAHDSGGFLTPAEFAKANGVSLSTVWRLLRRRELASVKRRGKRLIAPGAVIRAKQAASPVTADHPIWDSFYRINAMEYFGAAGTFNGLEAQFFGIFEDNDPKKRLLAIADYNNDVGEYWEFSDTGFVPIDLSNEAYKLGVNYVIYAMTH